jgi:hypothetical protein
MAAIPAQDLFTEGKCYECFGELTQPQILKITILARQLVALSPSADVTPQGLLTYATCYACYTGSYYDLMEIALLDQISQLL